MGLLNHLFGSKQPVARELAMDEKKRMALWDEHLTNFKKREELSRHFSYGNIEAALADLDGTIRVLEEIESLISPEMMELEEDERLETEMLEDLQHLKSTDHIELAKRDFLDGAHELSTIRSFLQEIHSVLNAQLHLIQHIKTKPSNVKPLLIKLFRLIFHNEALLYKLFTDKHSYAREHLNARLPAAIKAVLLEHELEVELETDEEKFVREMSDKMNPHGSKSSNYKKLAEDIFYELLEMVGVPDQRGEDFTLAIEKMQQIINSNGMLFAIIKKFKPRYDEYQLRIAAMAFRKSHELGHFEDWNANFGT